MVPLRVVVAPRELSADLEVKNSFDASDLIHVEKEFQHA